ncbi:hypothetical protein GQ42DRAFT_165192 [Ramicandelaber brevisporus]|nr:hypothetical protein GQ42DRAFT_165192 [Ramicandelaber brevisporus]
MAAVTTAVLVTLVTMMAAFWASFRTAIENHQPLPTWPSIPISFPPSSDISSSIPGPQPTNTPLGFNAECVRSNLGFASYYDGCNRCGCTNASPMSYCTLKLCPIYNNTEAECKKGAPTTRIFTVENQKCLCLTNGNRVCIPAARDFMPPHGKEEIGSGGSDNDEKQKSCEGVYGKGEFVDKVANFKCACGADGHVFCQVPS